MQRWWARPLWWRSSATGSCTSATVVRFHPWPACLCASYMGDHFNMLKPTVLACWQPCKGSSGLLVTVV
jgi:hypothetical protein